MDAVDASGTHQHHWATRSTHLTSEGTVVYQACSCGRWRILRTEGLTFTLADHA